MQLLEYEQSLAGFASHCCDDTDLGSGHRDHWCADEPVHPKLVRIVDGLRPQRHALQCLGRVAIGYTVERDDVVAPTAGATP